MRLNLFTDYAIRSLMYLCWHRGRPVTAEEIASYYAVSKDHIVKVIQELSRQGYVQARRGRGGGSTLARDPKTITLSEILITFEGPTALLDCLRSDNVCVIEMGCRLKLALGEAQKRMTDYLSTVTLEDVSGTAPPPRRDLVPLNGMAG